MRISDSRRGWDSVAVNYLCINAGQRGGVPFTSDRSDSEFEWLVQGCWNDRGRLCGGIPCAGSLQSLCWFGH